MLQRKVAGRDGLIVQVWPDPGTDATAAERLAAGVAERIGETGP